MQHAVAERKNWAKFGQEKGNKPGPDRATTTVGENVVLKLSPGNKVRFYEVLSQRLAPKYSSICRVPCDCQSSEPDQAHGDAVREALQKAGVAGVRCRICKRDHFTARCPFKDTLAGLEALQAGTLIVQEVCQTSLMPII